MKLVSEHFTVGWWSSYLIYCVTPRCLLVFLSLSVFPSLLAVVVVVKPVSEAYVHFES